MHQRPKRREDGFGFHSVNLVLLSIQSEKLLLYDTLQERLLERIQRLEDDRHSVGLTSGQCGGVLLTPMLTAQHAFARLRQPALFLLPGVTLWLQESCHQEHRVEALAGGDALPSLARHACAAGPDVHKSRHRAYQSFTCCPLYPLASQCALDASSCSIVGP